MRQPSLKIAVFCLVCCGQIALAADGDTPPAVVKIARVETAPVIDGVLSEGEWTRAAKVELAHQF